MSAIVFDLDDTLYPERDFVLGGFRAVAEWAESRLGVPADTGFDELRRLFCEGVRGDTFHRWLTAVGIASQDWVPEMIAVYRDHEPTIDPFPEVHLLLKELRARHRLGLLSDGIAAVQKRKFAALALADLFDAVVFTDDFGADAWKPNSRCYLALLDELGVDARDAVYVADNPIKDFIGARRAGMRSIRVRSSGAIYGHLLPASSEHEPDLEIAGLAELETALGRLDRQREAS